MSEQKVDLGLSEALNNVRALREGALSRRSYFAAMAMQGLIASDTTGDIQPEHAGKIAVAYADALIAALRGEA